MKLKKKQNYSSGKQISGCQGQQMVEEPKGILCGDRTVLYYDCGGGSLAVYIC